MTKTRVEMTVMAYAPHCDSTILHAPGQCEFCDLYPEWQKHREVARIAFTGQESTAELSPCPSTWFRDPAVRDKWGGNVAYPYAFNYGHQV